jgi:heme-degrading monooxygenase HmoA
MHKNPKGEPMIVTIVRFKSELSEEQLLEVAESRAPQYRALEGLIQKYYLRYPETGEYGAVYVWETEEALERFRDSGLMRTIAATYRVVGAPEFQLAHVLMPLRTGREQVQLTQAIMA